MNCEEAIRLLYDIIDREASSLDSEMVRTHLEKCGNCGDVYKIEMAIQEFISLKLKATEPSSKLDTLKTRILKSLDDVDCSDKN